MLFNFSILKAQPTNDDICSATALPVNSNNCISGTNSGATTHSADPIASCWVGGTISHTVWYTFIAPISGNVTVTTDHPDEVTLTDPQLAIFSSSDGTCSGILTEIGCNDDINPPGNAEAAVTLTGLISGTTYFVELDGYSSLTGSFCIDVHDGGSILTNDNCADAMNLWVGEICNNQMACTYTNFPFLTTATVETWETAPACWTQGVGLFTVWYKFTAISTSTTLRIEANGGPDPHAAVYTGTCGTFTLHACQEDKASGGGSTSPNRGVDLTFSTTVGVVYYIQYDSDVENGCNNICLLSTGGLTIPLNDACASAQLLSLNNSVSGNNWLALADGGYSCDTVTNTVWYKFTPDSTDNYYFRLSNQEGCTNENNTSSMHTGFYTASVEMIVYNTGSCTPTAGDEINCTSKYNTNDVEISASLTAGNTYLIAIDGTDSSGCSFEMTVSKDSPLPISLLSFEGENEGNTNVLNWVTVSETNNDYFNLERSVDAKSFTTIGTVEGASNSYASSFYSFIDKEPLNGTGYYRLSQVDYDGKINYPGSVIAIKHNSNELFKIYPNPNNGKSLSISIIGLLEKELLVTITDIQGKVYYQDLLQADQNNESKKTIALYNNLPTGIYLITGMGEKQLYQQKLIVL